ncbi:MAG: T9SS type A sorting domain-containing protein [Candidatus Latescibacteria bacterium]|nr:T9SS type A sorting domain-containing protein [Candidatus Latescibacterota bacterium]
MRNCVWLCALLAVVGAVEAQEGYPPGTLVPSADLDLQPVAVQVPPQLAGSVPEGLTLNVPPGFAVSVFAAGFERPRFMAFDANGVLHVADMNAGQIIALPDRDGDGVADERIVAASGFAEVHSMAFYRGEMYVADTAEIVVMRDGDGDLEYEESRILAELTSPGRCCRNGWHTTRTIVIDEANEKIYVGIGSPCDLCRSSAPTKAGGTDPLPPNPEWGAIVEYNTDGTGRRVFATGVRNTVGLTLHPVSNELWGNNNGHDLEGRTAPPEWVDVIREGDFMGHPFVHSHQVWNDFGIERYERLLPISREDSLLAAKQKKPVALVPAHYAPMGIHFYTHDQFPERYKNMAFVAFRAGQAKLSSHPGYNVSALFSESDGSNARMADFITGFQTGTTQNSVWGFPVGLTTDAEGSLYVGSDARAPVILKVTHSPVSGSWEHDLPDALGAGGVLRAQATVQIERLDESGGAPRLIADLSDLGGPAALPLTAVDETTFQLDTRLDLGGIEPGVYSLRVFLEQEAGDRTHRFQLNQRIAILPPDLPILDDALGAGWQLAGNKGAQVLALAADGPVFHGKSSTPVRVEPENFFTPWALELQPPDVLDLFGLAGLRFVFHPGDVEEPNISRLNLFIDDLAIDLLQGDEEYRIDLTRPEWQVVEVPFAAFSLEFGYGDGVLDAVDVIGSIRLEGNATGTFYLDDVRLVTGIPAAPPTLTAVLESRDDDLPGQFALEQNHPNPFNSDTVIRYNLPQRATVVLDVFNLAGQEVARLVYGLREAGSYTVAWDGRDNADRALATGVYIYRLQAGGHIETRKLLLLR